MTKQILIITLIAIVAFAQPHPRSSRRQDGKISGAYHMSEGTQLQQLKKAGPFQQVQQVARTFYLIKTGRTLGDILSVQKQVVSGMNFKITFAASAQNTDSSVVIVVYFQPWTKTVEVRSVVPPIEDVTDEEGRVVVVEEGNVEGN